MVLSLVAILVALFASRHRQRSGRRANAMPVVSLDSFREHRGVRFSDARTCVFARLPQHDPSDGLDALPREDKELVRGLAWFHDNLGALVAHNVVDPKPVSACLKGLVISAVTSAREHIEPFVAVERAKRADSSDRERPQVRFGNLYLPVEESPPRRSRSAEKPRRVS